MGLHTHSCSWSVMGDCCLLNVSCHPAQANLLQEPHGNQGNNKQGKDGPYFPPALQPSPRKSPHSSQDVPLLNLHMPYSLPSGFFLISVVPPIVPQCTDAGFAMPAPADEAVVTAVRMGVRVCTGAGCCVHPAKRTPANRQRASMITQLFLDFMGAS